MLKKLQNQKSNYNVFNWECERKATEKIIRNIQYHKSGSSPNSRNVSKRNNLNTQSGAVVNKEMFELYQKQVQEPQDSTAKLLTQSS